jgi:hypothetical protein
MWIDDLSDRDRVRLTYRYLDTVMAIYFGQDMFDDYADEEEAMADLLRGRREVDRHETLAELDRFRETSESPEQFERDFGYLSGAYLPPGRPTPYRDFADRLATAIRASLD